MNDLEFGADSQSANDADLSGAPSKIGVHALVVSHDGARWLPELISSLNSLSYSPLSIRTIDTGSLDRSCELLADAQIPYRVMERDSGFGEAVSAGVDWIRENLDSDPHETWIWLLHDDCAPLPDALEKLVIALQDAPSVALAGPKIRGWHDRNHLLEVGISIAGNGSRWTGLERRERDQGQHDGIRDVLAVSTAGALIRLDVWLELAGFDPHLTLFRDDVDFGWRVNVAGHRVIAVPDAVIIHAEASATERRDIDVEGATLKRPHLLDRRHANYVLLANCSPWRLPTVLARLVVSTIVRSTGYLFAKLPGYAADELGALALFLARPDLIRSARKARAATRLLPANAVSSYLAPDGSQIRLAFEALRGLIFRGQAPMANPSSSFADARLAVSEDEEEVPARGSNSIILRALRVPSLALFLFLTVLSIIGFRGRFGSFSGGALLPAPSSGLDLLHSYFDSWHTVSLGSSTSSPPWFLLIGLLATFTFGNLHVFVGMIFILSMPIAGVVMYRALGRMVTERWIQLTAGVVYAFSPIMLISISGGELTLILLAILLPLSLGTIERGARAFLDGERFGNAQMWRALFQIVIILSLASQLILLYLMAVILLLGRTRSQGAKRVVTNAAMLLLTPFLALFPWSLSATLHPTLWLRSFGIAPEASPTWQLLFFAPGGFAPGGITAPPYWLGTPLIVVVLLAVMRSQRIRVRGYAVAALATLTTSVLLSLIWITPYGSPVASRLWVGPGILVATLFAIFTLATIATGLPENLKKSPLSRRHLASLLTASALTLSILGTLFWQLTSLSNAGLSADRSPLLPAFVTATLNSPERSRVLVIEIRASGSRYSVIRDRLTQLGDPEVSGLVPDLLDSTVAELFSGGSGTSSAVLSQFAIRYVFVVAPAPAALTRVLDGVGGLRRVSTTGLGTLWKISNLSTRLLYVTGQTGSESTLALPSSRVSARAELPSAGVLSLAEKRDPGWRLLVDSTVVKATPGNSWNPTFAIPHGGTALLVHDSSRRRSALALEFLTLIGLLVMCLPSGRRWIDRPDNEVA